MDVSTTAFVGGGGVLTVEVGRRGVVDRSGRVAIALYIPGYCSSEYSDAAEAAMNVHNNDTLFNYAMYLSL